MDFLDTHLIVELLNNEPGHGLLQTVLLAMIWWSARGVKTEIIHLKDSFSTHKLHNEERFGSIETRLTKLETETKGA